MHSYLAPGTKSVLTVSQRIKAHEVERRAELEGNTSLSRVLRMAAYFDGFPHSYTDEAVRYGRRLIVAAAEEDAVRMEVLASALSDMIFTGDVYRD